MEIKAISSRPEQIEGRTVTGLAAVFGNVDSGLDRLHDGAFRKTLSENARRVRHLWQHDFNAPPIASIDEIKEVGRSQIPTWVKDAHPEVTGGLMVRRTYLETPRGSEVLEGIRAGAINEMSFGFDIVKHDFEIDPNTKATIRNLREVKLFDTSDVVWGMNPLTVAAKTASVDALKSFYREFAAPDEYKAAGFAGLLQAAAASLMADSSVFTDRIEREIKALLDLLTAEPQSVNLTALTETLAARIAIAEHELF